MVPGPELAPGPVPEVQDKQVLCTILWCLLGMFYLH
jgi:hypothetical protein